MSEQTKPDDSSTAAALSKRELMKLGSAAAVGLGLSGATAGTVGATEDGSTTTSDDTRYSGNPTFESVAARLFKSKPTYTDFNDGISDRPIVTAEPLQIWVDPDGNDDAAGTESDPVASLQEALNRVPYIAAHPISIVLTSGTAENPKVHDTGGGVMSGPVVAGPMSNRQETKDVFETGTSSNFSIHSESGNPEDTILKSKYYLTMQTFANSGLNCSFRDLTLEASVQCYGGVIGIVDCICKGASRRPNMTGGYACSIHFVRGEISTPVVTRASQGSTVTLNGTYVDPQGRTDDGDQGVIQQYQSGCTVFVKSYGGDFCPGGDCINMPYFAEGGFGLVITNDNIYHPAAPEGIID